MTLLEGASVGRWNGRRAMWAGPGLPRAYVRGLAPDRRTRYNYCGKLL